MEIQTLLNAKEILENATDFEVAEYPLVKKENLENEIFVIFNIKDIVAGDEKYFNFQAVTPLKFVSGSQILEKEEAFCFNGGNVLKNQLDGIKLPVKVKLIKVSLGEKAKKGKTDFYWSFAKP